MPVSITQAAKALNVHPSTLRRWIARDCPCLHLGAVGRGKGSLVDLEDVQRWRLKGLSPDVMKRADEDVLALIARSFSDALKRDRAHHRAEIHEARAAGFLALVFERCWLNVTQRGRDEIVLPPEIKQLCAIWVQWREQHDGRIVT
jgi:hypothetical protein